MKKLLIILLTILIALCLTGCTQQAPDYLNLFGYNFDLSISYIEDDLNGWVRTINNELEYLSEYRSESVSEELATEIERFFVDVETLKNLIKSYKLSNNLEVLQRINSMYYELELKYNDIIDILWGF